MAYKATQSTEEDAQTFLEDTQLRMGDAFASFDPEPVASASLASVYRAVRADGSVVAVKIQHRTVARFLQGAFIAPLGFSPPHADRILI